MFPVLVYLCSAIFICSILAYVSLVFIDLKFSIVLFIVQVFVLVYQFGLSISKSLLVNTFKLTL